MAFNTTNEGVPYYRAPAPEVPQPDNTAAKIISQGGQAGVMGFVHMAIAAQQARVEQEQMLQKADLQANELQHQDKWNTEKYQLEKQNSDQMDAYRTTMMNVAKQNADSLQTYRQDEIKWKGAVAGKADELKSTYATTEARNDHAVMSDVHEFGLDDQTKWNNDPVGQIAKLNDLKARYGTAQVGAAPDIIKGLDMKASNIKIPFLPGAEYGQLTDPNTHQPIMEDKKPVYGWTGMTPNGRTQVSPTPLSLPQLLNMYQDPTQRQYVEKGLIAAGHGQIVDQITESGGFLGIGGKKVTTHVPTPDAYASKIMNAAKNVQPSMEQNRVPSILQQKQQPQWMIKAGVQDQSAGTGDAPGLTAADPAAQAEADHVKALMVQQPNYAPQLKATFYQTYPNFDPNYLDSP